MEITKIYFATSKREVAVKIGEEQFIIYSFFGGKLFCGDRLSNLIIKSDKILQEFKVICEKEPYFLNKGLPSDEEITAIKIKTEDFLNKNVKTLAD